MLCPYCGNIASETETGNGGWLFVAEEFSQATETFDGDIVMYVCDKTEDHVFYATPPKLKKKE